MLNDSILALLIAFAVTAASCPVLIPVLHRFKFGQQVRDDGPQSHLKKQGTPTMGGIMILLGVAAGCLPFLGKYPLVLPVLLFTIAFGVIGFLDDSLKILHHHSEGLTVKQKLLLQLVATGILAAWLVKQGFSGTGFLFPFTGGPESGFLLKFGILYVPVVFLVVLGTDNGTNFTDGLDGLCSSVTVAAALFFGAAAIRFNFSAAPAAGAVIGALLGFLLFNVYPAKVFMGDTGALALGGILAAIAMVTKKEMALIVIAGVPVLETLSVILQVAAVKTIHRRIFPYTPIHYSFRLKGMPEKSVVYLFWMAEAVFALLGFWIATR